MHHNIALHRMNIVRELSANIAESRRRDANYDVEFYLSLCKDLFENHRLPSAFVEDMISGIRQAQEQFYTDYLITGYLPDHNASGMHPVAVVGIHVENLSTMIQNISKESQHYVWSMTEKYMEM